MSGVFGLIRPDGPPATAGELAAMAVRLARRGPEGSSVWRDGPVGLGLTLLATTPEALCERLPLRDEATGCVITADVRLDNRADLIGALDLCERASGTGDAGLVLAAYVAWGRGCLERLRGDFAFAIRDPRDGSLFCARDRFGMRPLSYHHAPGRLFAFGSEPEAVLALTEVPWRINEGRIADVLVGELEGIDRTSTFFEGVFRLPPAHALVVTPQGLHIWRYWSPEPGPILRLGSDEAYAEAFLEVFAQAVRSRLRGAGPVGSMLSGGMDSGSVVAVARELLATAGVGPLATFSAISPDEERCVETRAIREALTVGDSTPSRSTTGGSTR